ncbi:FCS-Like Zinc finger 7-like [Salvia miltiorrhiza]|uniref:FCS-Like Zinc finger 7-like n=1 Tax=Salvia miltiorrhiza TaxID=226208 RepID=UPI0025AB81DF|nr:FCS-Like Zinc finger 7-like [Salvia miltiorrhiza]
MPVKRNRAGSSSAYLEASVASASSTTPVKVMKTDAAAETARPKLLDVASPVNIGECADRKKIGGFLERCHYCNKRIAQNSDVFMYSNLCAFCSVECRDFQINVDKLGGKKP